MVLPLIALLLTQAPAQKPFSVAMPGLNAVRLEKGEGELYTEVLAQKLISRGLRVMTQRDMASVIGLDRQKQLLGCSDGCQAELAAGLGVEGLVVGDLGKIGSSYTLTVKVLSAKDGSALALYTASARTGEDLNYELDVAGHSLATQLQTATGRADIIPGAHPVRPGVEALASPGMSMQQKIAIIPAAVGVVGVAAGLGCFFAARGSIDAINKAQTPTEAAAARDSGKTLQTVGLVGIGVGAAALAAGAVMFFTGANDAPVAAAFVTPGGAGISLSGNF